MQDSMVTTALTLPGFKVVRSLAVVRGITNGTNPCFFFMNVRAFRKWAPAETVSSSARPGRSPNPS
jgi:hypothetical protein